MKVCKARIDSIFLEGARFIISATMLAVAIALMLAAVGAEIDVPAWQFMSGIGVAWSVVYLVIMSGNYPYKSKNGIGETWRVTSDQMIVEHKRFLHDVGRSLSGLLIYLLAIGLIHALIEVFTIIIGYAIAFYAYFSLM